MKRNKKAKEKKAVSAQTKDSSEKAKAIAEFDALLSTLGKELISKRRSESKK